MSMIWNTGMSMMNNIKNIFVSADNKFMYGYETNHPHYRSSRYEISVIAANLTRHKVKPPPHEIGRMATELFKFICSESNPIIGFDSLEEAYTILPNTIDKSRIIDYTKEIK